jgi:DEAD/DEAH box helicase domain-containing protein
VQLRSASPDAIVVIEEEAGTVLGIVELERAYSTVHEGAVYLHLGEPYHVSSLDLESRHALVRPFGGDWYTMPKKETSTVILDERTRERRLGLDLSFGTISVTEQVVGYQRRRITTQEALDVIELELPQTQFDTESVWYLPEPEQLTGLDDLPALLGSLHAAEHAMIALLPLWAMCDRWDIGGLSTNLHPQTGRPTVFVYDGHAGGVGIAQRGFERFEGWVEDTARLLERCPCSHGCPSCVQSPKCGNLNEPLDKHGALRLLRAMTRSGS